MTARTIAASPPAWTPKQASILGASLTLFAERGFYGTTMPAIAGAAQVGAGTLYRYFENKEAIVNVLYQHHKEALGNWLLKQVDITAAPREQFHMYWQSMAEFARVSPDAYRFLELHHHAPYLDEKSRGIENHLTAMAEMSFENFRTQGIVKDVDPLILMAIVHGSFIGLVKACSGTSELLFDEKAVSAAEQCVWEAIRA